MEKIVVDDNICIGCGFCFSSSEKFEMNEDGKAEAKDIDLSNLDETEKNNILEIKEGCPVGAIKLEEK